MMRRCKNLLVGILCIAILGSSSTVIAEENEETLIKKDGEKEVEIIVEENSFFEEKAQNINDNTDVYIEIIGKVIVDEGKITGETIPGVSYDSISNTLVLNNADIVRDLNGVVYADNFTTAAMYVTGDVDIEMIGKSKISFERTESIKYGNCAAVYFGGNVCFRGEGELEISRDFDCQWMGIETSNFTMESGTISICASKGRGEFIAIDAENFSMTGGTLNIDVSAAQDLGTFYGITESACSEGESFKFSNSTVNIKAPHKQIVDEASASMNLGIDSQRRDICIENSRIDLDMGTAFSTFGICGGLRGENVVGGKITVKNSYIECKTNGYGRTYSAYIQDIIGKEELHFYIGEKQAVKEVRFNEAFEVSERMGYSRYECPYRCFIISSDEVEVQMIMGDVSGDGEVDINDLRIILRAVCGKINLTTEQITAGDVTYDGKVDLYDLRKVLRYICKKIEQL